MRKTFNKLAAGALVAVMAITALAPIPTFAVEGECKHSFTTATYKNDYLESRTCEKCGYIEQFIPSVDKNECDHNEDEHDWYNFIKTTCTTSGKSADEVCMLCGKVVYYGEVNEAAGHFWDEGKVTVEPTKTSEGKKFYTCARCGKTKEETLAKLTDTTKPAEPAAPSKPSNNTKPSTEKTTPSTTSTVKVGIKFTIKGNQYVITKDNEVTFSKAKSGIKFLTIPSTVKFQNITYKVTGIKTNAIKNNKKIKSVVIGANITSISNKSFNKCPNLKKVTIKTTALTKKTANKKCFNKVNKKLTVKVPKKVKKSYKKIFKGLTVK